MKDPRERARLAIGLLDLTSLNDDDTAARVAALAGRASTAHGNVAAICIWPRFIDAARRALGGRKIALAAVANFPLGGEDVHAVVEEVGGIAAEGADEVDLVMPWRAFAAGNRQVAVRVIAGARRALGPGMRLKVILESGELARADLIASAADLAIGEGADFIKTSTGKTAVSATPEAARIMLEAIRRSGTACGFKAAGGIRDLATASQYLDIAAEIMGAGWIGPRTFRFGASGLLDDLLARLGAAPGAAASGSEY
ncbi:MAG: deoxyribose-phosphate aldolase [Alphaproteobacteria bacterium]|nr:deoxyribose-phosphate aldolase [Alphaproteobacteria bacterium]